MSLLSRLGAKLAGQWIAGVDEQAAIDVARKINSEKKGVILNYLGEGFRDESAVQKSVKIYLSLLREMHSKKIRGSIAVKPSQLGMLLGPGEFYKNYMNIAGHARGFGIFVWLDMEEWGSVQGSVDAYVKALGRLDNIGICLQAKLKRSYDDARRILRSRNGAIRIVKGAYFEPGSKSYPDRESVRKNYLRILEMAIKRTSRIMVATHDDYLIYKAVSAEKKYGKRIMFGMLKGIRGRLAGRLADSGEDMNVYVPFGEEWPKYSRRRLMEEGHALLLIRSIFQQ
ncbi:MAG: proline dehydrogenase family protein [Candidatus Micrarchaeota archaeon]|nr:proline dehydrogenase family protein [Candidatus Micrarchaeota archaeon]MDE1847544.1 proline dehydrogenase family protein [Candidatus Micrarchaeota archaeon]MDE1864261.1 proline dehydrogenase family protein [Candidatus Micrarchaeota archaeon]